MDRHQLTRVDAYVASWGAAIALASLLFGDLFVFLGALIGAAIALANWIAFRYLGLRIAAAGNRAIFGLFLALKMTLVLGLIAAVLVLAPVNPLAFIIGLSSLVMGIMTHSLRQALAAGAAALRGEP